MRWADLVGTVRTSLRIGLNKAVIDAGGLTATRTFTLPDLTGTLALTSQIGAASGTSTGLSIALAKGFASP